MRVKFLAQGSNSSLWWGSYSDSLITSQMLYPLRHATLQCWLLSWLSTSGLSSAMYAKLRSTVAFKSIRRHIVDKNQQEWLLTLVLTGSHVFSNHTNSLMLNGTLITACEIRRQFQHVPSNQAWSPHTYINTIVNVQNFFIVFSQFCK